MGRDLELAQGIRLYLPIQYQNKTTEYNITLSRRPIKKSQIKSNNSEAILPDKL